MERRRVLLLCGQPLLSAGLEGILGRLEDVELIGPCAPDERALARLSKERPDVVVIAGEMESAAPSFLPAQILKLYPDLPVVQVELTQNVVRLYTSRELPARSADLIEALRSLPIRPNRGQGKA